MATTNYISLEEFHRLYNGAKPYHEYWFGEALPKAMPTLLHSAFQVALILILARRGWKVYSELTLKLSSEAELVPDVTATRKHFAGPYPTQPVELCIEILSPDDRLKQTIEKGKRYLQWGVGIVWIIDPEARKVMVQTSETPEGAWIEEGGTLPTGEADQIPVAELLAEVDRLL